MFWIGMIVGVIIAIVILAVFALVCVTYAYKSWDEFWGVCGTICTAIDNRESEIQIWHDGEMIDNMTVEEM